MLHVGMGGRPGVVGDAPPAKLTASATVLLVGYDLPVMKNVDNLSPGQRNLLDTLERLRHLDLGGDEPATTFQPTSWAPATPSGFNLAAIAARSESAAAAAPEPHRRRQPPTDMPAALPTVTEIVERVAGGATTAARFREQAQARTAACNPAVNAFITLTPERADAEARVVDEVVAAQERLRPLSGVPLAHKDIIATAGIRTTAGAALLRAHVPTEDATVVRRLSNAGTVMIGKANTHQFATGTTGSVSYFGAVRNPWNLDHMSGGSSSGSAAALATGMVAAATGTDTGGSIRIPAACCGVVGLKPTYGRVSRHGVVPFAWGLDHVGPMARRVRDIAALLTAMTGPDPFDRAGAREPAGDFSATLERGVDGLRFCVPETWFGGLATAPVANAVVRAAATLEGLGARRVDIEMPEELDLVGPAAIAIFLAEGGAVHHETLASHPQDYAPPTRAFLRLAADVSAADYLRAQRFRGRLADAMARVYQHTDVILLPTVPMVAPALDAVEISLPSGVTDARAALTRFTRPFNLTGLPALSLPCGFDDGLPIGLQIVGRPFDEAVVLRVAHAFEDATTWHQQRPPLFPDDT